MRNWREYVLTSNFSFQLKKNVISENIFWKKKKISNFILCINQSSAGNSKFFFWKDLCHSRRHCYDTVIDTARFWRQLDVYFKLLWNWRLMEMLTKNFLAQTWSSPSLKGTWPNSWLRLRILRTKFSPAPPLIEYF